MPPRAATSERKGRQLPGTQPILGRESLTPAETSVFAGPTAAFDPRRFLAKLYAGKAIRPYQRDEIVFSQGAVADAVFWILSGDVKLTVVSHAGKEAVIAILPEGSFFGEGCLAGQPYRMETATAMQHASVVRIAKEAMITLLHQEAEFAAGFTAYLLSRHTRMEQDLLDQLFNSSEKRLARLLLLMAHYGHESEPLPVIAKISHETLAEMIGTTRSRVTFFMNRFRKRGFIDYNHGMHVHHSLLKILLDE
ncbi:MAG TPA: Crp/Fnr family transcriptional regulator [Bryocella sp.]|nr:Crp/Fnr family transcriptional regulator [Bryocella sp.]